MTDIKTKRSIKNKEFGSNPKYFKGFQIHDNKLNLPLNVKLEGINIGTEILELNQSNYEIIYLPSRFNGLSKLFRRFEC